MKQEIKTMKVFNPYNETTENLICKFELHFNLRGKLKGVCLSAIISECDLNLMDYLKSEVTEEIEDDFLVAYNGN